MDLKEIAEKLVEGCRNGTDTDNLDVLYAPDAVSVEAMDMDGSGAAVTGLEAIKGKHAWWGENFEYHGGDIEGPFLHGDDRFAVIFEVDATNKATGERSQMKEVAVYEVANGKIVRESFFYG